MTSKMFLDIVGVIATPKLSLLNTFQGGGWGADIHLLVCKKTVKILWDNIYFRLPLLNNLQVYTSCCSTVQHACSKLFLNQPCRQVTNKTGLPYIFGLAPTCIRILTILCEHRWHWLLQKKTPLNCKFDGFIPWHFED